MELTESQDSRKCDKLTKPYKLVTASAIPLLGTGNCNYLKFARLHQQKKLKFNVSGNNITLAEFLVIEILKYLLRFRILESVYEPAK